MLIAPFFSVDNTLNITEVSKPHISRSVSCDDSIEVLSYNYIVITEANNELRKKLYSLTTCSKGAKESIRVADQSCAPQRSMRGIRCKDTRRVVQDMYYIVYWNVLREVKKNIILR